jgi:multidrug efflux pump subunit AcrB
LKGARQIGFTVVSLSISLIAVFIPLLFMTGIVGRLFREFAITLSIAVIASAVVSLTLTPMMCAKFLKPIEHGKQGKFFQWSEGIVQKTLDLYEVSLKWVLRHRFVTLMVAIATLVITLFLYVIVPKGLLPLQDTGEIIGVTDAAQNISFAAMVDRQQRIADIVRQDPDVQSVAAFVGAGTVNQTPNSGRLYIVLKPRRARQANAQQIIARLRQATKGVQGISLFNQAAQDLQIDTRVSRTQYQYILEDTDSKELGEWSDKLLQKLKQLPELRDVATDQQSQGYQVFVNVDREKASRLNVQTAAINNVLYDCFGQRQVSIIFTQLNQYRVILEVLPEFKNAPSSLDQIYVNSSTGQQIPLSAFATMDTTTAPLVVTHQDQLPAVTLSFNVRQGGSLGEAVRTLQEAKNQIGMPETITGGFYGTAAEFQSSLSSEPFLILAAVIVIYIVLGVLYESYIHPITILSTLPSAGVGALLALLFTGIDFSLISLIGIILLIGIVKKNAIMMIDFALDAEREQGLPPEESIYQACLLRFRPIMMTTMAALLGALPLAVQEGTGAELRKPLGITIVGGLLLSQFLTLYTTPVIYLYMDKLGRFLARRKQAKEPRPQLPEPAHV